MSVSALKEGIGPHAMWGMVPAADLLRDGALPASARCKEEVRLLLLQPGDIGHVLKTMACRGRHPANRRISFYVHEPTNEVLARHLLLLAIAHDWEIPIRQRANVFLEVFGNCMVQDRTARYIARLGRELIDLVCSGSRASEHALADIVDLSLLKHRQKDALETIFRSWACNVACDMPAFWDHRLRNFYGQRYDARETVCDWDYFNRLKPVASIVHLKQYRAWRKTGLAYEFGDQVYNEPNRTMISYAEGIVGAGTDRGYRKQVRGFWLDVRCGPFSSFAVDCDKPNKAAKDLFEIHSKGTGAEQQRHHAVEIAVYNMLSYLWEIETETVYLMTRPHEIYSGLGATEAPPEPQPEEIFGADVQEEADRQEGIPAAAQGAVAQEGSSEELAFERARHILQSLQGVKIFLLGGDWSHDHCGRARHSGRKFDAVCISATAAQLLGKEASADLCGMLANEATISVDTAKYLLPLGKDLQHEWNERIRVMASEQGFEPLEPLGMDDTAGENSSNHCEPQLLFSHHAPPPSS